MRCFLQTDARLVVVECVCSDEAEWRARLEARGAADAGTNRAHKPGTWAELQAMLQRCACVSGHCQIHHLVAQRDGCCHQLTFVHVGTMQPRHLAMMVNTARCTGQCRYNGCWLWSTNGQVQIQHHIQVDTASNSPEAALQAALDFVAGVMC